MRDRAAARLDMLVDANGSLGRIVRAAEPSYYEQYRDVRATEPEHAWSPV